MAQSARQEARRRAQQELLKRKEEAARREARVSQHVIDATTAHVERQRVVEETERRIAASIHELVVAERLSPAEVSTLTGLEVREVHRLRRLHAHQLQDEPAAGGPSI